MPSIMDQLSLIDIEDKGWPFAFMSVNEISLINCPNLVLPAAFRSRDTITIHDGPIRVTIAFDGAVIVTVTGARFRHTIAQQKVGEILGSVIDISQLSDHPVSAMKIHTIDVLEDGLDIELS